MCAQAAFVGRGEAFCPESRYPSHCCSRPRLFPAAGTHGGSLVSFFPSPHFGFSLLCGSLGGIFGLEGGEPDGSCLGVEHALPGRGRKGNGEWEGGEKLAGRIRGLGEGGARLSLES